MVNTWSKCTAQGIAVNTLRCKKVCTENNARQRRGPWSVRTHIRIVARAVPKAQQAKQQACSHWCSCVFVSESTPFLRTLHYSWMKLSAKGIGSNSVEILPSLSHSLCSFVYLFGLLPHLSLYVCLSLGPFWPVHLVWNKTLQGKANTDHSQRSLWRYTSVIKLHAANVSFTSERTSTNELPSSLDAETCSAHHSKKFWQNGQTIQFAGQFAWSKPNSHRTRDATPTQIGTFFLWCCLRAVWTLPLTTTGPICLRCVALRCVVRRVAPRVLCELGPNSLAKKLRRTNERNRQHDRGQGNKDGRHFFSGHWEATRDF